MRYNTENSYSIGNPLLNPTKAYSVKYVGYYWTYARFSDETEHLSVFLFTDDSIPKSSLAKTIDVIGKHLFPVRSLS